MPRNELPTLDTQPREKTGTRYAKRLREEGRLPVVIYGHGHDPVHKHVDAKAFHEVLHGNSQLVSLKVDGADTPCLFKDVQYDYLHRDPIHCDFAIVNLNEVIETEVPIELTGEPEALNQAGAVLNQRRVVVNVSCKAGEIPDVITHDISELTGDAAVHLGDLKLPAGVELADDPEFTVASITIVAEVPDADAGEDVDPSEPELIGKNEGGNDGPADAAE